MRAIALAYVALSLFTAAAAAPPQDVWTGVSRVVAVGDVHGDYDQLVSTLAAAGVIDGKSNWTGGTAHLVQLGDVVDRGPDSRKAIDLLMKLEKQAVKAGGRVHALIGNHEAMNTYGDLRYVSAGEYAAFRNAISVETRRAYYARFRDAGGAMDQAEWESRHPLGFVEHRLEFGPDGRYGRWIRSHNAMVKINSTLFVHGGISPKYAASTIADVNARVRMELAEPEKLAGGIVVDMEGPLWYRGLAKGDEAELAAHVGELLKMHGVERIVVAHTISQEGVRTRFDGRVVMTDVGMSKAVECGKGYLVIEGESLFAVNGEGVRVPLSPGTAERASAVPGL